MILEVDQKIQIALLCLLTASNRTKKLHIHGAMFGRDGQYFLSIVVNQFPEIG
jgi:hypothetical protein